MTRRLPHIARQRGFTLIELMATLAIGTVVGATFFSVVYMQNLSYLERLDELDAHQNARAALNILKRYTRLARYGLSLQANATIPTSPLGTVPIGACFTDANPQLTQWNCNNVVTDGKADRLRVVYIVQDAGTTTDSKYSSNGDCTGNSAPDPGYVHTNTAISTPFLANTLGAIGGNCASGGSAANDAVIIVSDAGTINSCAHRYKVTRLDGQPNTSCGGEFASGFNFGRAVVADFFIQTVAGVPQLMMRTDPTQNKQAIPVAFDIEDLQVQYGVDAHDSPDNAVEYWCNDPRVIADGGDGSCETKGIPSGTAFTTVQNYNRIIAVKLSVRVRSDNNHAGILTNPLDPNSLSMQFNPVTKTTDGYKRWIYSTVVSLRNNTPQ